jgi:hypothetical protein
MRDHLSSLVDSIIKEFQDKEVQLNSVLDIAANDLYTLKCYPKNINRTGIDPCDIIREVENDGINVINECFPTGRVTECFDVITSIACFYDIENPLNFVKSIEKQLTRTGVWVVEFAYLPFVLQRLAYDEICLEHVNLYSIATFEYILNQTNLRIFKGLVNDINGGSIQLWITHKNNIIFNSKENNDSILDLKNRELDLYLDDPKTYEDFTIKVYKHREKIVQTLKQIKDSGKTIHILGASTKLNTLLQFCNIGTETIEYASERSAEKIGATTIDGIKIISEEDSRNMKPDFYFVGPYHFFKEILIREKETIMNGTSLIFPLPELTIINKDNYCDYV